jgi:hypothetical protein
MAGFGVTRSTVPTSPAVTLTAFDDILVVHYSGVGRTTHILPNKQLTRWFKPRNTAQLSRTARSPPIPRARWIQSQSTASRGHHESTSSCTARCCRLRLEYLATRPYPTLFWWFVCKDHQDLPRTGMSLVVRRVYQYHATRDVESNHQISHEMGIDETCAGQCRLPCCLIPRQ